MTKRSIYFVKGYVIVHTKGKNALRFIRLCLNQEYNIWNIVSVLDDEYIFCISLEDIWKVKPYVRKTHVKLWVEERRGVPFVFEKYKNRGVFVASFLLSVIVLFMALQRIWCIEISGASENQAKEMILYLEEQQIELGCNRNKINCNKIEQDFRLDFEEIVWSSVCIDGTTLRISIANKTIEH